MLYYNLNADDRNDFPKTNTHMKNLSQNSEFRLEQDQIKKVKGGVSKRVFSQVSKSLKNSIIGAKTWVSPQTIPTRQSLLTTNKMIFVNCSLQKV